MSFSSEAKAELCRLRPQKKNIAAAECYGILLYGNSFSAREIRLVTAQPDFAALLPKLFHRAFGLDFVEAAKKYSVFGPDEAERWTMDEYSEIANEKLRDWAFSAPVGSIGGPFDVPDGLAIVKIVDRSDGPLEPSLASELVANVTLSRIGFYMIVPDPEPRTREHVREALTKWKMKNAQMSFFKELHDGMKIEYPQGTNFVYNAEI